MKVTNRGRAASGRSVVTEQIDLPHLSVSVKRKVRRASARSASRQTLSGHADGLPRKLHAHPLRDQGRFFAALNFDGHIIGE